MVESFLFVGIRPQKELGAVLDAIREIALAQHVELVDGPYGVYGSEADVIVHVRVADKPALLMLCDAVQNLPQKRFFREYSVRISTESQSHR